MKTLRLCLLMALPCLMAFNEATAQKTSSRSDGGYKPKMLVYENLTNSGVLQRFEKRFLELDSILKNSVTVSSITAQLKTTQTQNMVLDSLYSTKTRGEIEALRKHNGLEVTGQVYGRLDNAIHLHDDDDDLNSSYKAKFQAELGWNIVNSKFYQRKDKEQQIYLSNEVKRLEQYKKENSLVYDELSCRVADEYGYYIAVVLLQRLHNIDLLNEAHQYMLEQDRITTDKMLDIMNDKMEIEYQLALISETKTLGESPLYRVEPTQIMVDTIKLYNSIFNDNISKRILEKEKDLLDNKSRLTNWISTTRISPFARWSSYIGSLNQFSQNVDAGVRFTFPIWNETAEKRKAIVAEKSILDQNFMDEGNKVKSFCILRLSRIKFLNSAIAEENSHIQQLGKYLEMRKNAYLQQKGGYNYIARMEEYNEYLRSMERMYRLMLQRTQTIIEIQKQVGINDMQSYIIEKKYE